MDKKSLIERLSDPKEAAAYLNAALAKDDIRVFLLALRDIVEAHGGISTVPRQGNPTLISLFLMFDALGLELQVKEAV